MPEMMVWPVSLSVRRRNVGSSSASRCKAVDILSASALVLGSIATEMTGSGKLIDSRMIGLPRSDSVSPVNVCLRPTMATMSPAYGFLYVLPVVSVHPDKSSDALPVLLARIET